MSDEKEVKSEVEKEALDQVYEYMWKCKVHAIAEKMKSRLCLQNDLKRIDKEIEDLKNLPLEDWVEDRR